MSNILGSYDPIFYAQTALEHLRKNLGLAARVYRRYEQERNGFDKGSVISIRKPATFTALAAPSTSQNLDTEVVTMTLDQYYEVKYELTDKDYAFTGEDIIRDHIQPAAYAIANKIDQSLAALYVGIPWLVDYGTATDHTIITLGNRVLFDNEVPVDDGRLHLMVDGLARMYFQNAPVYHAAATAGEQTNLPTLLRGTLGERFGVEVFASQNAPTHTPGTGAGGGDAAGTVTGAHAKGATSLVVGAFGATETVRAGDTFVIAGNTQRYSIMANSTASGGAHTLSISPPLVTALAGAEVVTLGTQTATAHSQLLMFHEQALGLVMAPLRDNQQDIQVFTAVDPQSRLSVRARRWTDANNSKEMVALDALWAVKVLSPNHAVRLWT